MASGHSANPGGTIGGVTTADGLIRRARRKLGLTQGQVARAAGVGISSVSDAELTSNPSIAVLARYGRAMGLELCVFYITAAGEVIELKSRPPSLFPATGA
jgi:transcriptional regulator with XRE-family HTH domain